MSLEKHIATFSAERKFQNVKGQIRSMDFSSDGKNLAICCETNKINLFDCEKGTHIDLPFIDCYKYGVGIIKYANNSHPHYVIHSSTILDDHIRVLNLNSRQYKVYFKGHNNTVTSLSISPYDDTFLSGSKDNTAKLWDLRSSRFRGFVKLDGHPVVNYDPEGLIFAIGINSESINLYDMRYYEKGPFKVFELPSNMRGNWTSLKFSPNGKSIMINAEGSLIHLIDAFTGKPLHDPLNGRLNQGCRSLEASFSPDSNLIFSGSDDGKSIIFWEQSTGKQVLILKSSHMFPVKCVEFNPRLTMFASAGKELHFWVPANDK